MNSNGIEYAEQEKQAERKCIAKINILTKNELNLKEMYENSGIQDFFITIVFW